ncbi:hypothetical protein E4K65_34155 [Bradyrhizobium niftali]|uniref:Uncharacterized protein n=1 Tax=Bradyrhizobium niftali TaxID=2560055 RepID=A0A4Y9LFE9_9BRAD|nr:hypothetical protein E4K65_34155 [Bradyrhizobium niftali]
MRVAGPRISSASRRKGRRAAQHPGHESLFVRRLRRAPPAAKIPPTAPPETHRRTPWEPPSPSSVPTARTPRATSPMPRAATRRAWS